MKFLTAVANNRKKLLSIVLLPYCCLNCCLSRLNHRDAPDREVTEGFHTTLRDSEGIWRKRSTEMCTLVNPMFLPFLEMQRHHGEISKLK